MSALTVVSNENDWPYRFEVLPVEQLFIDARYQRPLSTFVKKIVDQFDPALLNTLVISARTGRKVAYAVIDGQTRLMALRQLGHMSAPCLVYGGLTVEQEADLFSRFQSERKNVSPLDRFRAALVAQEPLATAVEGIASNHGFVIENSNIGNSIVAVRALEDAYKMDEGTLLDRVLSIIAGAWKHRTNGGNANDIIRGLAYFLDHNNVDDDKLIRRLSIVDPDTLRTRAGQLRQGRGMGGKSPMYMAEVIGREYRRRKS